MSIENDLRSSKEFLETVLDSMNDALSIINAEDFRIVDVNKEFLKQYCLEKHEVIGKTCYGITHHRPDPCSPPNDVCPLKDTLKTGRYASAEHVHYLPDGEKVFVEVSTSPIRDKGGNIVQVVHIARDITGQKRAEETMKEHAMELEEANCLKDLFTDIIGHDLLTPITVIKAFSEMLGSAGREKADEIAASIQHNAGKIEDMVRNISKLARVQNFQHLEKTDLDLVRVLSSAVKAHEPEAKDKGMKTVFEHEGKAHLTANPLIEDIFSNILSNAIKYAPRDTTIALDLIEEPESWVVSCSDEGEDIPDAYKESIFERYGRHDKMGVKGTGLGLAIAKRVVDLHGGSIWAEDNPMGGNIFRVRLPKKPR
jgi:PAS domain S-box-containing protein